MCKRVCVRKVHETARGALYIIYARDRRTLSIVEPGAARRTRFHFFEMFF